MENNHKLKKLDRVLGLLLKPAKQGIELVKKAAKKTYEKIPFLYREVGALIESNVITIEKDRKLLKAPNLKSFSKTLASNIIKRLPQLNKERIDEIIAGKSSKSFLDMLTQGLGATIENEKDYTVLDKKQLLKRILIANRGEIALRVIRACKELGIKTVMIYSKIDKDSMAVKFADKAVFISADNGYLDYKKIIKIAKRTRSRAIHPGYGFLAENADFAEECKKRKIKFIGPSVKTISTLGDKIAARKTMAKAGVPVIPGSNKEIKNENDVSEFAGKIGYPLIIKAAAGGGGKGMRIVRNKEEIAKAFKAAKAEAKASFNDDRVYIEKYFKASKHVEFQILADKYGNIIHLGERDCSIQRRHQKLVEEAPSPAITDDLREKMGEAAINAVKAVGYEGAGTVEFLLDKNNNFYFMEMNTRIQVEHGITEMITGIDLVKEQIKIASGAKLAYKQEDIRIKSHAIECRINAEDPTDNFKPATGTISNYLPPGGPGIRVCSSCHSGHVVSPHYDSLIAKLICGGETREEAIARMKRALDEYVIEGVTTTIPLNKAILNNNEFLKGNITTNFIEKNKIIEELKKQRIYRKKELPKAKKALIISTAVANYMEKNGKSLSNKPSAWVTAGREESSNQEIGNF